MPTQEELNALQVELDIAADNEIRARNKIEQYEKVFTAITEMPAEKRKKLDTAVIQNAIDDYKATKQALDDNILREATAEFTLKQYQDAMAQQQTAEQQQQRATSRRKTINREVPQEEIVEEWAPIYNDKWEVVWQQRVTTLKPRLSRPSSFIWRKAVKTPTAEEAREDIYNSWGWEEFKKWFNNALVDDLVMPVASALWASDDTLWVLSELKMPTTEREMASKYYAYWWRGKDAADAALQYLGLKGAWEILGLTTKTASPAYTVANSWRWIYNTPYAWEAVNRAWSSYSPAYWGRWVQTLKSAWNPSTVNVAPREFWRYVETHPDAPILSTINNFKNNLL